MKKLIVYFLLLAFAFFFTACATANKPITDLKAFEEQVFADYIEQYYPGSYPHERPTEVVDFRYYGTDNGYHIILLECGSGVYLPAQENVVIADCTFKVSSGKHLRAYKNGSFTDLRIAYRDGLVSKEAIAKAAELHAERKNATE